MARDQRLVDAICSLVLQKIGKQVNLDDADARPNISEGRGISGDISNAVATSISGASLIRAEIYRIVSDMVVTNNGVYEKPVGWTGTTGSPTFTPGFPDPEEANLLVERVHEIGFRNDSAEIELENLYVPLETADGGFTVVFRAIEHNPTTAADPHGPTAAEMTEPDVVTAIAEAKTRFGV